jgi:hypothetical protein
MKTMEELTEQYSLTADEQARIRCAAAIACMGRSLAHGMPDMEPLVQMIIAPGLASEFEASHDVDILLPLGQ